MLEDGGMQRLFVPQSGTGLVHPRNLRAKRLEAGKTNDHALTGFEMLDRLDPAAAGRQVEGAALKAEASGAADRQLGRHGNAAAATPRIFHRRVGFAGSRHIRTGRE